MYKEEEGLTGVVRDSPKMSWACTVGRTNGSWMGGKRWGVQPDW